MTETVTTNTTIDTLTGLTNAESINLTGFGGITLTIDVEPQEVLGVVNGVIDIDGDGTVAYDASSTRLLPYDGGSGTPTPAIGDTVEGATSGATGEVIAFLDTSKDRNGTFQSAAGYLKLRSVSGGPFQDNETVKKQSSSGEWTGLANGADEVGFLAVAQANGSDGVNNLEGATAVTMTGEWYYLTRTSGVDSSYPFTDSDGLGSQTWEWYLPISLPCVWVETGDGTDVWQVWLNSRQTRSPTGTIAAVADAGHRGADLFDGGAASKTITFGDGTNGNIPVAGARVRVPNLALYPVDDGASIHTPALATSNGDDNISFDAAPGSSVTMNKALLWGGHNAENGGGDLTATDSGIMWSWARYNAAVSDITMTRCGIGLPPTGYAMHDRMTGRTFAGSITWTDCIFGTDTTITWEGVTGTIDATNSCWVADDTFSASAVVLQFADCPGQITLTGCHSHNGWIQGTGLGETLKFIDHSCSAQTVTRGWEMSGVDLSFNGMEFTGDTSNWAPFFRMGDAANYVVKDLGTVASPIDVNGQQVFGYNSNAGGSGEFSNVFITNGQAIGVYDGGAAWTSAKYTKVWQDYADGIEFNGRNMLIKAARGGGGSVEDSSSSGGNVAAAGTNAYGSHFLDSFTADTEGFVLFSLTRKTDNDDTSGGNVTYSGDYHFNSVNELVLRTTSSYAILEMPYFALGHDGLKNQAIDVAGYNSADESSHFTVEYQIDKGSGYGGTWTTASAANLSGETGISETTGIKIKIRVTPTSNDDTNNRISAVRIWTTTTLAKQEAIAYPEPTIPFTISGIEAGSNYRIETVSGGTLLTSGTAASGTVTGFVDTTDGTSIKLIVGFDDYVRFTGTASASENGTTFVVIQTADSFRVASDATAAAYSGVAIDGGAKTVTVTAARTHQELYDFCKQWSIQTANLQYDVPLTTVDGVTFNQTASWSITISGSGELTSETTNIDGTVTVASGGFYEGLAGAKWESGGSIYYGSHFWINVKKDADSSNIQDAIIAFVETDGNTDVTYSAARVAGAFVTDASGDAEGYAVYRVDSTTYGGHNRLVGEYGYDWSNVPSTLTGAQVGTSSSSIGVRLNVDSFVVKTKANALAVSGVTVTHASSDLDTNSADYQDVYDNLKARQARAADIESGKPGFVSFLEEGLILTTDGSIFTQASGWTAQNAADTTNILKGGTVELGTAGDININLNGLTVDYTAASGTFDHRGETMDGTITLVNSGGGSLTVQLDPSVTYVNTGPNITIDASIAMPVTAANLIDGTKVQIYNVTQAAELDLAVVSGGSGYSGSFTFGSGEEVEDGDTIRMRAAYASGTTYKQPINASGAASSSGIGFVDSQSAWSEVESWAVDGSGVTEFTLDVANLDVDLSDGDGSTTKTRLIAWWAYQLTQDNGIRNFWGAFDVESAASIKQLTGVADVVLHNTGSTSVRFTDTDIRLYRDDNGLPYDTSGGSIFMDYEGVPLISETGVSGLTTAESNQLNALPTLAQIQGWTVDSTLTFAEVQKVVLAALAGERVISGDTINFRDEANSKNRIAHTTDANGNTQALTLDVS